MKDLARVGAATRISYLQAQIDELLATFPGLKGDAVSEQDAMAMFGGTPRRRRLARRRAGKRRKAMGPRSPKFAVESGQRRPRTGELKAFVLAHGDFNSKQSVEARRLHKMIAKQGIATSENAMAATLSRVRHQNAAASGA